MVSSGIYALCRHPIFLGDLLGALGAAGLLALGVLFLRDQAALGLQVAAATGVLVFVSRLF